MSRQLRFLIQFGNCYLFPFPQVLMDDINAGYERLAELQVRHRHAHKYMDTLLFVPKHSCILLTLEINRDQLDYLNHFDIFEVLISIFTSMFLTFKEV